MNLWTGVVWIIVLFLSAVGTLILTASIHYRGSIGEQVMENVSQSDEETNSWRPEGKYIFSIPRDRYWGLQIHINSFIKEGITNLISHTSILLAEDVSLKTNVLIAWGKNDLHLQFLTLTLVVVVL